MDFKEISKEEFKQIYLEYFNMLCNYAYSILKERESSKDIVQEIFSVIWKKRENLIIKTSLESYLLKSVKFKCIDSIRSNKVRSDYENSLKSDNILISEEEDEELFLSRKEKVLIAISKLPEKCRIIFLKSKLEGYTYKEIAEEFNISVKTIENQISRAFKIIKKNIF